MTNLLVALDWLARFVCSHEDVFRRADGHLTLQCVRCGRCTAGIRVHRIESFMART